VRVEGSSRKENRTNSRVCKLVAGYSGFSVSSSKLLIVAVFLGRLILPIGVVSAWPCRRQQSLNKTATIKAPMEVLCEVIVDSVSESHGRQPPLVSSTLASFGRSIVNVGLGETVLNGLLLGAEMFIGCVVFGG